MKRNIYTIWKKEEYTYPAGKFIPKVYSRIHDDGKVRPAVLIAPGGAYALLTPMEVEGMSKKFYDMGFNSFVLVYTNNVTQKYPLGNQPLKDISRAVQFLRKNSSLFR